ncbi:MAG TPA: c-type cytochrome [Pseudomonadales bacterium]
MRALWMAVAMGFALLGAGCGERPADESAHPGEQVYIRYCFSCHAAGVAGAPRVGDGAAWAERLQKGRPALLQSTITGVPPGMPPKGLCTQCSEEELAAALDYMIERSPSP